MTKLTARQYENGRSFMGRIPHGTDLLGAIEAFCVEKNIATASFWLIGAVSSATIGAYDQTQQVYVSFKKEGPLEIISCHGNVSSKDGKPFVHAHILLGDADGNTLGGHLFSETIVFACEIVIQELRGETPVRIYDETTGLMLWDNPTGGLHGNDR